MNYALKIQDDLLTLRTTEKKQTKAQYRDYVRFLRLLKSGEAKTQAQAAKAINITLRQAQRVWKNYQQTSLQQLISPPQSAYIGKISTTQISHLRRFLMDDQASTLADIKNYLSGSLGVEYTIGGVFDLCKRLGIKRKTGRPVHAHQPPGAVETYKKKFSELSADFAYADIRYADELRAGTRTDLGRKWGPSGHRPISPVKIGYESVYLYLALCPFTGKGFATFLPKLNGAYFRWFIDQINGGLERPTLFVADGAKAHKADYFAATHMTFSKLPPACAELNPVERVFLEVRRGLKSRVFATLAQAQSRVKEVLEELFSTSGTIVSLACFPYIAATLPTI